MKHWTVTVGETTLFGFRTPQQAIEFAEMLKHVVIAKWTFKDGEDRWVQEGPGRIRIEEIDIQMFPEEPEEEQ